MLDAPTIGARSIADESVVSAVSWSAIAAGGVAAAALTLLLLAFGAGMGFSAVSPWSNSGVLSTALTIGAGLYLIVVAMLASTIGGYVAGRLRSKWVGVHAHEVYFRDTAHGFLAWAFATVLSAAFLTSTAAYIAGGASAGLAGAATSQPPAAIESSVAGQSMTPFVDRLFRTESAAGSNAVDPAIRGEVARLFAASLRGGGDLASADRTYLARVVAAHTGLSQPDADKRVTEVTAQAKTALDDARRAAAGLSLWLAASMLIGAFSASLAATEGGVFRDGAWTASLR